MASKKTTVKQSRPSDKSSSKETRSKYTKDSSIWRENIVEELSSSTRKAPSMAMRPVVNGRCIIFIFLDDLGLQLGDKIEEQGWVYFCSLNTHTYPNLVYTFYENLIVREEHIKSKVKGKRIILSKDLLSSLL